MNKTLKLNNGTEIPIIGLGTYSTSRSPGSVRQAVKDAIDAGYRHIDCAWMYGNEVEVGEGIRDKIEEGVIKREDIFVTTKLWITFLEKEKVVPKCKESLNNLNIGYIDLYLIHGTIGLKECDERFPQDPSKWSDADYLDTWKGMEECVEQGLTKSIGVSNFNSEQIDRILKHCNIKPVCNQVEVTPNLNQKKLIAFCKERDIVVVGYSPLGQVSSAGIKENFPEPTIWDPRVAEIGRKYNKTPAQVVLNYLVTLGISVIPKSQTKSRIQENISIFDFQLSPEDIAYLDSCNKNQRVVALTPYKNHKHFSFNTEF